MRTFENLMATALMLILVYLILSNAGGASNVIRAGGGQLSSIFKTLQARD